jgi:hypothetical protein
VFDHGAGQGAFQFGFEMGTGVRTYVSTSTPYVLLLTVLIARIPVSHALLAGFGFGSARAMILPLRLSARFKSAWDRGTLAATKWIAPMASGLCILSMFFPED